LRNNCYKFCAIIVCNKRDQLKAINIFFILLSGIFSEALQSGCKRCTEKQKQNLELVLDWYTTNDPVKLQNFIAKSIEDLRKKNSES